LKKKLLIINKTQFGYHIDTYMYCKYLAGKYEIMYICYDHGLRKIVLGDIKVHYVLKSKNIFKNLYLYLKIVREQLKFFKNKSIIFIKYFRGCSLLHFLRSKYTIFLLDIRTASVVKNTTKRKILDAILIFESKLFKNKTVISEGLKQKLFLGEKTKILPIGADVISNAFKNSNAINLLYVGSLINRDIIKTLRGFNEFIKFQNNHYNINYHIIGFGNKESKIIKEYIKENKLSEYIHFHGRIEHGKLRKYFNLCNVGVSFIPITDYYNHQPPTKTYEYICSGLFTIATSTIENRKIINNTNGIIISDSKKSFVEGLKYVSRNINNINNVEIKKQAYQYSWKGVVNNKLISILENINE